MTDHRNIPAGASAGVLVLHAWWGLNNDVRHYADRLAEHGYGVLAPDLFGGEIAVEIEDAERLARQGDATAGDRSLAALDQLAAALPADAPVAVVGFSFGAAHGIWLTAERPTITACVVYYGSYWGDFLSKSKAAFLGHFAENDPYEPPENVDALRTALHDAGREATIEVYPGTGHWFAEPSRPDAFDVAAADLAWERTVEFLAKRLGSGSARWSPPLSG